MSHEEKARSFALKLGHDFRDAGLLAEALTHSSFANETAGGAPHNERLEFLGDAVLSLCVSGELFARFPQAREGELTRLRSHLVGAPFLAELAREIGLDACLRLGRGEESQGGRTRDTLLGDALEAVLGAVFTDGGFASAKKLVRRWYRRHWPAESGVRSRKDCKTLLQEVVQRQSRGGRPVYTPLAEYGPEHAKLFEVRLVLPDGQDFTGRGHSLKRAEQEAAAGALRVLTPRPDAAS
jgi:ribonuclease-3